VSNQRGSIKWIGLFLVLLVFGAACSSDPEIVEVVKEVVVEKEVVKTVEVPGETVVKEVVKTVEVPGETIVKVVEVEAAPAEKVLRFRIGQTYATFAPHAAASSGLALFYDMLYSRLLQPNPDGFFEGDIAEKWEMAPDASSYTFWLDPRAKWHDGTPVTANDVKFTYTSYVNPAAGGRKVGAYSIIKGATAFSEGTASEVTGLVVIDDHTIRIDMEEPSAIFLQTCCSLRNPILPEHIYRDVAASDLAAHPTMTGEQAPIGSGPFKFVEHVPDQFVTFVANDDYRFGRPKIDRIEIHMIPSHDAAQIAAERGEVDVLYHSRGAGLYQAFINNPNWTVKAAQGSVVGGFFTNYRKPYLQDSRVMQAMLHAVDREAIIEELRSGNGTVYNTPLAHSWYQKKEWAVRYLYDPDKARELLSEAAWDSSRTVIFNTGPFRNEAARAEAAVIQQYLADVGFKIEWVEDSAWNAFTSEYDFRTGGFSTFADPDGFLSYRFMPGGASSTDEDETGYIVFNPDLRAMIIAGKTELDRNARAKIYQDINDILIEDLPYGGWFMTHSWYPQNTKLRIPHFDRVKNATSLATVPVIPAFTHRLNVWKYHPEEWDITQ